MFRDRQRKEMTNFFVFSFRRHLQKKLDKFEVKIKKKKNYFFKLLIKNIEKNDY